MQPVVYFAGSDRTVSHHAAPLQSRFDVRILPPEEIAVAAKPGDLAIFYTEHFDAFREASLQLKAKNVATLYMVDGILEWRNAWENSPDEVACPYTMRPALSNKIACIGASQARTLAAWGNADKVEVVGIPRLDHLPVEQTENVAAQSTPDQVDAASADAPFRLLVMTAKTPAFTVEQLETVRQSLRDLIAWQQANSTIANRKIEFTWRLTRGLAEELSVDNQLDNLAGGDLHDQLKQVDAVITTPSTALLEAMRMGLPVAQLDYHNRPHYVQTGWDIAAADHIGVAIKQMADREPVRMLFQRQQLADSLYSEGNATERLAALIDLMLEFSKKQITAGQPLNFPANMLPRAKQQFTDFDHASLYGAVEFQETDPTVLQCQLSHSRREIDHLHGQMQQLQSELDQAHQIFETINSHPVVGPIVRIRQRMIDLMTKMQRRKHSSEQQDSVTPVPFKKVEDQ